MLTQRETIILEENIRIIESTTFEDAIKELLTKANFNEQVEEIYKRVLDRESVVSTSVGKGLAIPHGRCSFVDEFSLIIGICPKSNIKWQTIDQIPLQIICLLIGPENRQRDYLLHLANITSILKEEKVRSEILLNTDKKKIVNLFNSC